MSTVKDREERSTRVTKTVTQEDDRKGVMSRLVVPPNGTAIDSSIYRDIFSKSAMREVWSDQTRIHLGLPTALSTREP